MSLKTVVEKVPGYNSLVKPLHWGQALVAEMKYDFPAKKLRVIAVTGTNGKTTTCFMIWKMLNASGRKAGLLTTVAWGGVGGNEQDVTDEGLDAMKLHRQYEHMTTERVEILNQRIRAITDARAEFVVLEVTSHALSQYRILGVPIEIAVFTNLTHEHLDYHKTFENYRAAKGKLFKHAHVAVINADDDNALWFVQHSGVNSSSDILLYGIERGVLIAKNIKLDASGVEYSCHDIREREKNLKIKLQIPGKFNVYNSLAAVAVGRRVGLTDKQIADGIYSLEAVEGRMTRLREGQDFEVIVDYAHAPDALEKVFESIEKQPGSRIISVHGGAGRRDPSTRMIRGEILGRESDVVIITEDDSRDENPEKIAAQFVAGAEVAGKVLGKDLLVELDREKAIQQAIKMAKTGDIVLLLGKGHEKTILRADGAHPFEDIKVARAALRCR